MPDVLFSHFQSHIQHNYYDDELAYAFLYCITFGCE